MCVEVIGLSRSHVKDERLFMVLFVAIIVFSFSAVNSLEEQKESKKIIQKFVLSEGNSDVAFIVRDRIDRSRLERVSQMSYEDLKQELGIKKEFYMFFEDQNGNMVPIGNRTCIGSPMVEISGQRCG